MSRGGSSSPSPSSACMNGRRRVVYLLCRGFGIGQFTPSPWALSPRIPSARRCCIYRAASGGVEPVVRRTHGLCLIPAGAAVRREPRTRRPAAAGGLAVASRRYHKRMCCSTREFRLIHTKRGWIVILAGGQRGGTRRGWADRRGRDGVARSRAPGALWP